jgi:hypothetical protein
MGLNFGNKFKGCYSDVGSVFKNLNEIYSLKHAKTISIYYDDADQVPKGKQRYAIGIILNDEFEKLEGLFIEHGYKTRWITKINYAVVSEFPWRTDLSPLLAILLVYPKIKKFIQVNNYFPLIVL